ncbi:hypothetical protein E4U42_004893 [Claviceps africana]|uniref:COP9 signalosome complex subunit 3 N-terminal helical repeats domain-containing protein n=1 Tax=Claviceps africana TaxID=83212 RepID=A0A8K0J6S0_9HYPO|nr:hypothetical protein E4U42_004893 [Claviceps africana]
MEKVQDILRGLAAVSPSTPSAAKAYDGSIRQHIASLKGSASEIGAVALSHTKELLESINPSLHSISYLFVLRTLVESSNSDPQVPLKLLLDAIVEFLLNFDPLQIRYVGQSLRILLEKVGSGQLFSASAAVELLAAVILRIDPTGSLFTSTHFILAQLAYNSNSTEAALRVIDRDILFYPHSMGAKENSVLCDPSLPTTSFISTQTGLTSDITTAMVLEYNHVRGLMYISRRDWIRAKEAFEQVVSHPIKDRAVSRIMVDSYKRWVLVALLGQGRASALPSYTTATAQSSYKISGRVYNNVAETFPCLDAEALKSQIQENAPTWEEDGTSSLVQEVLSSYQKWQVAGLRKTHKRVEISVARQMTSNAETGKSLEDDDAMLTLIRQMMADGMLHGSSLEQDDSGIWYLFFSGDSLTEAEFAAQIAQSYQNIESISKQYKQMNDELSSSKEYVKHLAREQKRAEKDGADAGIGFDSQIEDEDLMSGTTYRP